VLNLHALGARGVIVMHAAPPLAQELDGNSKKGEAKFMSGPPARLSACRVC